MFSNHAVRTAKRLWGPNWEKAFSPEEQDTNHPSSPYDAFQVFRESFSQRQIQEIPLTEESLSRLAAQGHWTGVVELAQKLEESMTMRSQLYNVTDAPTLPSCFTVPPSDKLVSGVCGTTVTVEGLKGNNDVTENTDLLHSCFASNTASEKERQKDGEEQENDEVVLEQWLEEHRPGIRGFLRHLLSHPRILLADPDLTVWHREWVNRLPYRTAQAQAWWKMKQYTRSASLLLDFVEVETNEEVEISDRGRSLPRNQAHLSASSSISTSLSETFLHPTTGYSIVPFSLRYMTALLPFYLDPQSEEGEKRLTRLLQISNSEGEDENGNQSSEVEREVLHLIHIAHLFIPSSSWYAHHRTVSPSARMRKTSGGGVQRGPHFPSEEVFFRKKNDSHRTFPLEEDSHHSMLSSHTKVIPSASPEKGNASRQRAADRLFLVLYAEAQSLIQLRWIARRQRLLAALAFVRYSQRRVSLAVDAYRESFEEERKKWAIATARVEETTSTISAKRHKFTNMPMLSGVPRLLPFFSFSSERYGGAQHKNNQLNSSNATTSNSIARVTDACLLFSVSPCIFLLFRLLRQACFSLQLGNRRSAQDIQNSISELATNWGDLGKEQHEDRVRHLKHLLSLLTTSAASTDSSKNDVSSFSSASTHFLSKKMDLTVWASRSFFAVFQNFLTLLQQLLKGFFAMSSESFEAGIQQFSNVAEDAQRVIRLWMDDYTKTAKASLKESKEQPKNAEMKAEIPNRSEEKKTEDRAMALSEDACCFAGWYPTEPFALESSPKENECSPVFSSGRFLSPQDVEDEILNPWIRALEKEEKVALEAVHRLRSYAQISHITSLLYTPFINNEVNASTISQPDALPSKVGAQLRHYLRLNPCGLVHEDSFLFVASRWFLFASEGQKQADELTDVMELMGAERAALSNLRE